MSKDRTPYELGLEEAASGVKEVLGDGANPRVMEYLSTVMIKATDDVTPWCSAFVNWCMVQTGVAGTNSAASASWMRWGEEISEDSISQGDIIGFVRPDGSGHVGFFHKKEPDGFVILGGNQNDAVSIAKFSRNKPNEKRVWYFRRSKKSTNSKVIVGSSIGVAITTPDVLIQLKELKETVTNINKTTTEIKEQIPIPKEPSALETAWGYIHPMLVLAILFYVMRDRIKKITGLGI